MPTSMEGARWEPSGRRYVGWIATTGGALGLLLAPIMVIIKYMTGWAIVPEPGWVGPARHALGSLLQFAAPPSLWTVYGSGYTAALLLMFVGLVGLRSELTAPQSRLQTAGYWTLLAGMCLVIPGDAIHSWTWHQNGLTTPTPGTNPMANIAYAVHMMGMNVVMLGSTVLGVSAQRRKTLVPWLAWSFVLIFPSAVLASVTILPTTPSGGLWWFSALMVVCGYFLATGRSQRLVAAQRL